jgi:hypothetical protein
MNISLDWLGWIMGKWSFSWGEFTSMNWAHDGHSLSSPKKWSSSKCLAEMDALGDFIDIVVS